MEFTWPMLALLAALLALAWFWHDSLGARESANRTAQDTCRNAGAQFLDGTVAFRGLRTARSFDGRMTFRRTYVFDYTTDGVTRQQGFIILTGRRVDSVGLE